MVYTITLTNPLASGHDGSWKLDLLMEAVVGTPAETPGSSLANGDPPTQAVGGDHQGGDGGVGGTPTGANGGGAGASADASSSQQQPPTSDNEEVDDISSDDDDDDDDGDGGCVDGGDVPDTSAQDADLMDASEISEDDDEDMDDRDSVVSDNEDALIGTLHQPGGTEPRSTAAGEVAEGVGNGARTDGAAAVDMMSSGAKGRDQPGGRVDLSPQAAESSGGVEHEAEGPQGGPAAAPAAPVSTEAPPAQQQQQQQMLVVDLSSEDETITQAYTERRDQPGSPSATQLPGLSRPGDRAGRRRTRTSPPPSPPASPARSSSSSSRSSSPESVTSRQSAGSVGDDSDSAFDGSDENSSASDVETEDLDSDDYETDILPPTNCFQLHQDRRTYKKALCLECYKEYAQVLKKANLDISDVDSDTGRPKKTAAYRRRKKNSASGGGRSRAGGGKRPRKSRGSSSGGNSSEERRKRRKVVGASSATASSAPVLARRLVKPHRKKAKKLAAGNDEAVSNAMLLEDTSSSSSDGGGEGERSLRRVKGKNKRVAEKPRTNNSKAHSIPRKKKQGSGPDGGGAGGDLLGTLIGNPAPARKKTNLSAAAPAAPAPQGQGKRPKLARQRSADDTLERRGSRDGEPISAAGSDGRGPPQLARGGSLDTATRSLSLSQYRVRKDTTGVLPSSSLKTPGQSVAGSKAAKGAPNQDAGKKITEGHARRGSNTPALQSSTNISVNRGISNQTPTMPVQAPSNKLNDKYEKVDHFKGVRRKKSNGKYFVWVKGAPLDGTPYETAEKCAKAYDQLYPPSAPGNQNRHRLNFGDARAPSHVDSDSLTPLVGSQGSRLSKGTLTSGYKQPRRSPFFAPAEMPSQPQAAQAPPRPRPAGAARGQQAPEVAVRPAPRRPTQAVAPLGAPAVMELIHLPSARRGSTTSRDQNASLPPVAAFNTLQNSKVKWKKPLKEDEDLNGRRVLPKPSVLPKRSALAGSKAVPDTRASCAQTGISGTFLMPKEKEEDEGQEDDAEVGAGTTQSSPERAVAPAPGSPLLEHVSDDDGAGYDNFELESGESPQAAEEPAEEAAAAPAAAAAPMSRTAATSPSPSPRRAESLGLQAVGSPEENGDEERGIELMRNLSAGNSDEGKRELTSSSTEGAAAAEADDEELGGEEEQGRELLMMGMTAGGGTPPRAVSSTEEQEDEAVPPSSSSAAESDDDGSGDENDTAEDDSDAAHSPADEGPQVIAWKMPKPVGSGSGGGGGSRRTPSGQASSPGRSSTGGATSTVVHKPVLTMRSHTRFGTSVAARSVPGALATGASPLSSERSPPLPFHNDVRRSLPDASTMPAPSNPPLSSSGPPQHQVAWRTPAAVTPTTSVDRQRQEQSVEPHDDEDTPMELGTPPLELPPTVVDALNPPAVRVLSSEVPSTSWRQPARAVSHPARHQAQRHVVPPPVSTSPPSSVSSAAASPTGDGRAEPIGRGSRPLPRFGTPFRPPDERDGIPQGQLNALSSNAQRLAASKARAAVLPRQQQRGGNGRPEADGVPFGGRARGGEHGRPVVERRSRSSSSGPTSRESSSSSSSSSSTSRQRRPDYPPRDEFGRNPRDGYGRGSDSRGYRDSSYSSNSSRNSSRTGPGGRMVGYHDRGDRRDAFGRDHRDGRGTGGYDNNRNAPERDARNGGRGGRGDFDSYRGRKSEQEGGWEAFSDRQSEHNGNRSRSRQWRERSKSPQRGRRMG